jgi:hypothetical protein
MLFPVSEPAPPLTVAPLSFLDRRPPLSLCHPFGVRATLFCVFPAFPALLFPSQALFLLQIILRLKDIPSSDTFIVLIPTLPLL